MIHHMMISCGCAGIPFSSNPDHVAGYFGDEQALAANQASDVETR